MAEVFVEFTEPVMAPNGSSYRARACGAEADDGLWQGWVEFVPADGTQVVRSTRETTQPNRVDLEYWATGLSTVYLEGSLHRALNPLVRTAPVAAPPPAFDEPASAGTTDELSGNSVLNPFSVYRKGEALLRRQLAAFSSWHLVNIIRAHGLSEQGQAALASLTEPELVELIIAAVRVRAEAPLER